MEHRTAKRLRTPAGPRHIVLLVASIAACATARPSVTRSIYDQGPNYVKLVTMQGPEGGVAMRFDHPVDFQAADFYPLLDQFAAARKLLKGYASPEPVFPRSARALLASHLAKAFNEASENEYVAFKFTLRVPALLLPKYEVTAGTMFVRDNEFHLQLEYFGTEAADVKRITYRPERRTLEDSARLELREGMRYGEPADGGRPYVHWVAADWEGLQHTLKTYRETRARRAAARDREAHQEREEEQWESFADEPVVVTEGEFADPDAADGEESAETRLQRLRDLREQNLITEEEYAAKRQEILEGL